MIKKFYKIVPIEIHFIIFPTILNFNYIYYNFLFIYNTAYIRFPILGQSSTRPSRFVFLLYLIKI